MIPAWVTTILVVFLACIAALWMGSSLADLNGIFAIELVVLCTICALCMASNNFPLLLAIGTWTPFAPPIPGFHSFPAVALVCLWMAAVLGLRLALKGSLPYRRSFNLVLLVIFAWVPIRFLMNPIHKLGAMAGGSGVSGATPYFLYLLAAGLLVFLGAIFSDRNKVVEYLRWCHVCTVSIGIGLLICAFIPATAPFLQAMGTFAAGDIGDGVQRLVVLPGYGLFLVQVSLCPALFRSSWWARLIWLSLGVVMIIVGGNRSALAAIVIVIPVVLLLRKQVGMLIVAVCVMAAGAGALRVTISNMDTADIPPMMRSLGIFDSKIEKASGGDASAQWRYDLWQNGIDKVMESPLTGKGYGNLPQHLDTDTTGGQRLPDFEAILAGGLAHNGFVSAAYGFGIPFAVALTLVLVFLIVREAYAAWTTDRHDPVLADIHAFLGGTFASFPILIYTAFDLNSAGLWIYAAISFVLSNSPKADNYPEAQGESAMRKYGAEAGYAGYYSQRRY